MAYEFWHCSSGWVAAPLSTFRMTHSRMKLACLDLEFRFASLVMNLSLCRVTEILQPHNQKLHFSGIFSDP